MGTPSKARGFRIGRGDATGDQLVLSVDENYRVVHVADSQDVETDWNVANPTHPTLYVHSATTPATDYITLDHDATDGTINVASGNLKLALDGTDELTMTSTVLSPATSDGMALGSGSLMWSDLFLASGGVINLNNSEATLTHQAGDTQGKLKFSMTQDAPNMDDGYGMFEVDATITGTMGATGFATATSAWVNITAGTVGAGKYVCARNDGVYEASAATITDAKIIFGARMQKILDDTDALSFPFSVNTNNTAITALIDVNNLTDLGTVANAGATAATLLPICRDAGGTLKYVLLYDLQ